MRILKSLLVWLCFIPAAILNGGVRQYCLHPLLHQWALSVSGVLLSGLIILLTWLLLPRVGILNQKERYAIACLWTVLTITFELIFGTSTGQTFHELVSAYNPMTGNLWILVVLSTALSPVIIKKSI